MTELCDLRNVFERKVSGIIKEYITLENHEKRSQILSMDPDLVSLGFLGFCIP